MRSVPKTVLSVHKKRKISVSLVGHGNLGRALAIALDRAGYQVREVIARDASSLTRARKLAGPLNAGAVSIPEAKFDGDVVFLCVPDAAIRDVATQLARRKDVDWRGKTVLHLSGALPSDELRALAKRGAAIGSAHPMNSFVASTEPDFHGIPMAIEGDRSAAKVATEIARSLGADPFPIKSKDKVLYHALGAFSSPLLVSHLQLAEQVGRKAGVKNPKSVIAQIIQRTLKNYLATDATQAFSGPLMRGDTGTIKKHLAALKKVPAAREAYLGLARNAVEHLPVRNRAELRKILK